jgi:anthranilate phosphoribosyltransferase
MADLSSHALLPYVHQAAARRHLTQDEARDAMRIILRGEASETQLAAFVMALHMKGETAEELAGFALAMREAALSVPYVAPPGEMLLDTCGTGGDGLSTFNISTTVAFVVAGCGVRVAKHGNRALSSASGSADVLERLGVTIVVSGEQAAHALETAGICFLFAPAFHPAMRHAQPVRKALRMRTVFNLLGPLANPAPTRSQIVGTHSIDAASRLAAALAALGLERGFVVHGEDGLDEVSLSGLTTVFEIRTGSVHRSSLSPEDFGLERAPLDALRGGDAERNACITEKILAGSEGPCLDIVLANAALALTAAGRVADLASGVAAARESVRNGAALDKLRLLARISRS